MNGGTVIFILILLVGAIAYFVWRKRSQSTRYRADDVRSDDSTLDTQRSQSEFESIPSEPFDQNDGDDSSPEDLPADRASPVELNGVEFDVLVVPVVAGESKHEIEFDLEPERVIESTITEAPKAEPVEFLPEPVEFLPEPVEFLPEPVEFLPEPVEKLPESIRPTLTPRISTLQIDLPVHAEAVQEITVPKIFIVDDSIVVRTKLSRLIVGAGYDIMAFNDGSSAVRHIDTELPSLLITDIEMPEMNGFEVIEYLFINKRTNALPIIAISGHDGISKQLKEFPNAVATFKKPWDAEALLGKISELVGPGTPIQ